MTSAFNDGRRGAELLERASLTNLLTDRGRGLFVRKAHCRAQSTKHLLDTRPPKSLSGACRAAACKLTARNGQDNQLTGASASVMTPAKLSATPTLDERSSFVGALAQLGQSLAHNQRAGTNRV